MGLGLPGGSFAPEALKGFKQGQPRRASVGESGGREPREEAQAGPERQD